MRQAVENDGTAAGTGGLERAIAAFIRLRRNSAALREGFFRELFRSHEQYAFIREAGDERIIVGVNAAEEQKTIHVPPGKWRDLLSGEEFIASGTGFDIPVYPSWLRVLAKEQ
jgi:hypothetical protein